MQEIFDSQITLISSKQKQGKLIYQVEKQGIIYLRNLKNKKFRIILNLIPISSENKIINRKQQQHQHQQQHHQQQHTVNQFNSNLLSGDVQNFNNVQKFKTEQRIELSGSKSEQSGSNCLKINKKFKQISDNRIIVVFNAYLHEKQQPKLLIFGYLIASSIFYHNWSNEFSQESYLTKMLCEFKSILKRTDIDSLNQNIKFKTGYNKTPYFLCLLGKDQKESNPIKSYQNYLNEFYRFQSQRQNSKINCALQAIIDYFPDRSSLGIEGKYQNHFSFNQRGKLSINELRNQFQANILGRQLFNFQFTGTTIQNLAFQMSQAFNSEDQINLVHIYQKVILNKKSRILEQSIRFYLSLIQNQILKKKIDFEQCTINLKSQVNSVLPISDFELKNILNKICQKTIEQSSIQALNCMNLEEYLDMQAKMMLRIKTYEDKIYQLNSQLGAKFVNECFQTLDIQEQQLKIQDNSNFSSEYVRQVFQVFLYKLQAFSNQCVGLFTQFDKNSTVYNETFLRLIKSYFQKFSAILSEILNDQQISKRKDKLEIQTLKYELRRTKSQKKKIEQQYQLQLLIVEQYKNKVKSYMLESSTSGSQSISFKKMQSSTFTNSKQFYKMKKQIQQLQEEVKDKNNHIEELTELLDKFQITAKSMTTLNLYQKRTDKFNQQTLKLINQANSKISKFYEIMQDIKNTQKHYESVKKLLMKEREKIISEKRQSVKQILELKEKNQKIKIENQKLQQIISEEKQAIQRLKQLREALKQSIDQLQTNIGMLNCQLAETQGQFQSYKKALKLVLELLQKGKSQSFLKFYKLLEQSPLKQMLKPIASKK